jgi:tetratricopeptide (TPR) repeat protein
MSDETHEFKIEVIQINDLKFPPTLLDFVLCQFNLCLERKPYIVHGKNSLWKRFEEALIFSMEINSNFFLTPEYTLPFSKAQQLIRLIKDKAPINSVYCIPVEHLTLKQLQNLANLLNIAPETLNLQFPSNFDRIDRYAKLIFNVAIIALKDDQGNLFFYLQPKIFPALFEESQYLQPYLFQGGQVINVFKTPRLSFMVMICFDFIGWGRRLLDTITEWLIQPENDLDFLFILQVNPKPLHREYERGLYRFANHPACQYTSLFFVNCDSTSYLEGNNERIEGFNKTAVLGNFKLSYSTEYKVEGTIEIPPDKYAGQEILHLDRMRRLMLVGNGERVVWLRTNVLRNKLEGPTYPRENDIRLYTYKTKSLTLVDFTTTFEHVPMQPLPDITKDVYRPITIEKPPIFVGRSQEVSLVLQFLKGAGGCLLIHGDPGIGKSSLSQFVAYSALNENQQQFSAGIWFSSKDRQLSMRRFLSDIAVSLDYAYLQQLDETEQKSEIIRLLRGTLKQASIIIIDNIENIIDSDMMSFIEELSKCAKVILTSRDPNTKIHCSKLELLPMKHDEIRQLIQHRWPGIDGDRIDRISGLVGGSPFAINLLLGYLIAEKSATLDQTITAIELSGENVIDWIFQKAWNALDPNGQTAINSFQLFADSFAKETVQGITDISMEKIDKLFEEFKKRYFIETMEYPDPRRLRYQIHPLVRKFSEAKKPEVSITNRYVDYYRRFVKEHCEAEDFKYIDQEIRNIEKALELCVEGNKLDTYLTMLSLLYYYYYERGFWNDAIEQCVKGYEYAQKLKSHHYLIEMSSRVSWCAFRKEEFSTAKEWLNIAKEESRKSRRVSSQSRGLLEETEARICLMDGEADIKKAHCLIETAIERYKSSSDPGAITLQARALSYLGELYMEQKEYQKAIEKFSEVKELAEKYRNENFTKKIFAWTEGNLGEALLLKSEEYPNPDRKEYLETCTDLFKRGINIARQIERKHTIAHCCWGLGMVLLALRRTEEGKNYLLSARDIYKRLGKKSRLSIIDASFHKIDQAENGC